MDIEWKTIKKALWILGALSVLGVIGGMYGCPKYNVWQQGQRGEAEFARAEQNRKIAIQEAEAKLEASKLQAKAEVERAKGIAEANKIVADGLKGKDEYLRYLWIDKISDHTSREIIYVPTEAGVPILEANRLRTPVETKP